MKKQIEALKTLWPLFLIIGSAFSTLVIVYVNVFVGDIAIDTLKGDAAKLYLQEVIEEQLLAAGVAKSSKIVEMDGAIVVNANGVIENKADIVRVESKAERIAQILMEE